MDEPQPLAASLASLIRDFPPGTPVRAVADAIAAELETCRKRRAAVLKHDDLAGRLRTELGYRRPGHWNGWIPPAAVNEWSAEELLRSPNGLPNARGKRSIGELVNDSPQRNALVQISTEAWAREHSQG